MKLTNLPQNASEDFVDEASSLLAYKYADEIFKPLLEKFDKENPSVWDEATHSAISTLKFGIMSAVTITVTEFFLAKGALVLTSIFAYLAGTNAVKKTKNTIGRILNSFTKATGMFRIINTISNVFLGSEQERIAKATMVNDTSNQMLHNISLERGNQIQMKKANYNRQDSTMSNAVNMRNNGRESYIQQHTTLMQQGLYKKTTDHKKIYEKATGFKLSSKKLKWDQIFVDKLNSYSNFASTAEGKIVNLVQTQLDFLASQNYQRSTK